MAENSTASPKMDPISQTSPTNLAMPSPSNLSHSSPSIDIPQISSPSLPQISQQQLKPLSMTQQQMYQQQQQQQQQQQPQQHQSMMGMGMSGFQAQQGMQRSASAARMNQIQQLQQQQQNQLQQQQDMQQIQQSQPQQLGMLRQQQGAVYGHMNFGRSMLNQQTANQQEQQQLQHQQLQQQQQVVQQQQPLQYSNQQLLQQHQLQRQQAQHLQNQQQVQQQSQTQLQQQPQQQQQLGGGNLSQSSLMGQSGHVAVLPGQATPAQFNLLSSPRQKASILHGSQFQSGNSAGQPMPGMQALQMVGSLGFASQIRGNAPYGQQRVNPGQLRQLPQSSLTSPQLPVTQNLSRASSLGYMNPTLSALHQNSQNAIIQNTLSQQQQHWVKQIPSISSGPSGSSSSLRQRQLLQQQMTAASPSQLQQSMSLNPQQLSQIQQSFGHSQLQSIPQQQIQRSQLSQQHLQQQPAPRAVQIPQQPGQKSMSLTGPQPDTPGGSSSQGTEATSQLLGKRKIRDLVSQVDAQAKLHPIVEDLLLHIGDCFLDSVTAFACSYAKHRKSSTLEAKDVVLHLERNLNLRVPGYSSEEPRQQRDTPTSADTHQKRLDIIRAAMEASSHPDAHLNNSREMMRQGMGNLQSGGQMMRPIPNSDQLIMQSTGTQMLQQMRF